MIPKRPSKAKPQTEGCQSSLYDQNMAKLVAEGNVPASEWLVREFTDLVYRICSDGSRKSAEFAVEKDVADLVLQVFAEVLADIHEYSGVCPLADWVRQRARRVIWRHRRQHSRRKGLVGKRWGSPVFIDMASPKHIEFADRTQLDPEQSMLQSERLGALEDALAALPPLPQKTVRLLLAGHTYREIAEILGITVITVTMGIHRARKRLMDALLDYWKGIA